MVAKRFIMILLVLLSLFLITGCDDKEDSQEELVIAENSADIQRPIIKSQGETIRVDLIAREWMYEPSEIRINQGDHVILSIASIDIEQGFVSKSLGINEELVSGKTIVVEFDANTKGTYEISCGNYCQKESLAMDAKIIIE